MAKLRELRRIDGRRVFINPDQVTAVESFKKKENDEEVEIFVVWLVGDETPIWTYQNMEAINAAVFSL